MYLYTLRKQNRNATAPTFMFKEGQKARKHIGSPRKKIWNNQN